MNYYKWEHDYGSAVKWFNEEAPAMLEENVRTGFML